MLGLLVRLFWNGIGEPQADPKWPGWFQKYHKCLFYRFRTAIGIPLSNQRRKWKYVDHRLDFLGINIRRLKAASATADGRPYVDQVSPSTCLCNVVKDNVPSFNTTKPKLSQCGTEADTATIVMPILSVNWWLSTRVAQLLQYLF